MSEPLTLALPKGRILDELIPLFDAAAIDLRPLRGETRKLVFDLEDAELRILSVRASDVPAYVQYGSADAGVVGLDVLREQEPDVYEPLDLGIGRCRMVIAQSLDSPPREHGSHLRVATKYPRLTDEFYLRRGVQADIIKLYGSIELAAVIGLADQIVDLVSTGETLKQNRLRVVDELMPVSSRLIVNRAALKLRWERMQRLIGQLRSAVSAHSGESNA